MKKLAVLAFLTFSSLTACAPQTRIFEAASEDLALSAETEAKQLLAQLYGGESAATAEGSASTLNENSTDDEIAAAAIERVKASLEKLALIDRSTLGAEHVARLEAIEKLLKEELQRLENDAEFRHLYGERERARMAYENSEQFQDDRAKALQQMCDNLEKLIADDQFPSEDIKKAVLSQFDRSCKSS